MAATTTKKADKTTTPTDTADVTPDVPTGDVLIAEAVPTWPPAGAELLKPLHQLPRRTRATLLELLGSIMESVPQLQAAEQGMSVLTDGTGDLTDENLGQVAAFARTGASMLRLAADAEDALTVAAIDPTAFGEWAAAASESDLFALFNHFTRDLGEALASPS